MNSLINFRSFESYEAAATVAEILERHHVYSIVEQNVMKSSDALVPGVAIPSYALQVYSDDFEKAQNILMQEAEATALEPEATHYLHSFSNDELLDVIRKKDEWNEYDVVMAKRMLKTRGIELNQQKLYSMQSERLEELLKPREAKNSLLVAAYICLLIGGLLSMGIGCGLYFAKRKLPDGSHIMEYQESDRKHGLILIVAGASIFVIGILSRVAFLDTSPFFV